MPKLCNVVVLISGSGSNLQALIDSLRDGATPARIRAVISNRADAYGLERARQAGIQTEVLCNACHGKGLALVWPWQYADFYGDVMTAREAPAATQASLASFQSLRLVRAYSCSWNLRLKFSPVNHKENYSLHRKTIYSLFLQVSLIDKRAQLVDYSTATCTCRLYVRTFD